MADVTNIVLGMHLRPAMPEGQTCDLCDDPATIRVQGETDSFGAEWCDWCEPHYRALMEFGICFTYCTVCDRCFPLADEDDDSITCHHHRGEALRDAA